jgi:hypothetical protein
MKRFKNERGKRAYRLNLFQIPYFKIWINPKQRIDVIGIGGESPGKDFISYKMYGDEYIETELNGICIGTTKVYPIGEVNDRIICILKEDAHTGKDYWKTQMVAEVYVPREEVIYLFYLYLFKRKA